MYIYGMTIRSLGIATITVFFLLASPRHPALASENQTDPRAIVLLNQMLQALTLPTKEESVRALVPLLHESLLNETRTGLSSDVRQFSFKKARHDAPLYDKPANVVRTNVYDQTSIRLGEKTEEGALVDYFIHKSTGMPAPVKIFFPKTGAPVITYIGNL
jgi:hypothetical protein